MANPKYGSEKKGAPTNYYLTVAPERIRVNCELNHVDVVLCCDPKAFTHTNPLAGVNKGGCLVWESSDTPENAWERIPKQYREFVKENNIRVFISARFRDCPRCHRTPRPATAHAGQLLPRRLLQSLVVPAGPQHRRRRIRKKSSASSTRRSSAALVTPSSIRT